jgi:hypothetical protein
MEKSLNGSERVHYGAGYNYTGSAYQSKWVEKHGCTFQPSKYLTQSIFLSGSYSKYDYYAEKLTYSGVYGDTVREGNRESIVYNFGFLVGNTNYRDGKRVPCYAVRVVCHENPKRIHCFPIPNNEYQEAIKHKAQRNLNISFELRL